MKSEKIGLTSVSMFLSLIIAHKLFQLPPKKSTNTEFFYILDASKHTENSNLPNRPLRLFFLSNVDFLLIIWCFVKASKGLSCIELTVPEIMRNIV